MITRRRSGAVVLTLAVALGAAGAAPVDARRGSSTDTVSGSSPFPDDGCGQADEAFVGTHGHETDLSIAVNPRDHRNIAAAWAQDRIGIVVASTRDGGARWTRTPVPGMTMCTGGDEARISHARLAFDGRGRLYVTGETLDGYFPDPRSGVNRIPVSTSVDGGRTWPSAPVFLDDVAALNGLDTIAGKPDGGIVVAWHGPEPAATSYLSTSPDGSLGSWQRHPLPTYAPDALPFERIVIDDDGTHHLFRVESTTRAFPALLGAIVSQQLGIANPMEGAAAATTPLQYRQAPGPAGPWTEPVTIAADVPSQWPSATVEDGRITVAWWAGIDAVHPVFVSSSVDGAEWSPPVHVADSRGTATGPMSVLSATPGGDLALATKTPCRDGIDDCADEEAAMVVQELHRSSDGGVTWHAVPLDEPFPFPADPGYYEETAAVTEGFVAVYLRPGVGDDPSEVRVARLFGRG